MLVRDRMTANPITVTPNTPVFESLKIMRDKNIRRLPVLKDGKLVGIVTELDLLKVSPSQATSLSVYELNYLLAKTTIKEAMSSKLVTVTGDTPIEEAAILMRDHKIGGLPVIDEGKLVGIITETDVFDAFVDLLGVRRGGERIVVKAEDRAGIISELTTYLAEQGINILSLVVVHEDSGGHIVLRVTGPGSDNLANNLRAKGYEV